MKVTQLGATPISPTLPLWSFWRRVGHTQPRGTSHCCRSPLSYSPAPHSVAQGGDNCSMSGTRAPNPHPNIDDKTAAESPPHVKKKQISGPKMVSSVLVGLASTHSLRPSLLPCPSFRSPKAAPSAMTLHSGISLPIKKQV